MKKKEVRKKDIQQLSEYREEIKRLFPNRKISSFLAGQELENGAKNSLIFRNIKFKKYFHDIPFNLKLCEDCRRAVRKKDIRCNWCSSQKFIKI